MMGYNNTTRDSTVTFRGVRSLRHVIEPGQIGSDATCPGLVTIKSIQEAKTYGDSSYVWYVKRPENTFFELIEGEHGAELVDYDLVSVGRASNVTYTFRRKVMTLTDEAVAEFTLSVPNMLWQVSPAVSEIDLCGDIERLIATSIIAGSTYEWKYNGNTLSTENNCMPTLADLGNQIGDCNVVCTMSRASCKVEKTTVIRTSLTYTRVRSTEITLANCGNVVFIDGRDGQEYCTIKIGDQCWMGKNLKYKTGQNWEYDINRYGRYYDWATAMGNGSDGTGKVKGICPDGWHLPSTTEWGNAWNTNSMIESLRKQLGGLYNYGYGWESMGGYGSWWTTTNCTMIKVDASSTALSWMYCGAGQDPVDGRGIRCVKD